LNAKKIIFKKLNEKIEQINLPFFYVYRHYDDDEYIEKLNNTKNITAEISSDRQMGMEVSHY
jgi:hypothetical protein